MSAEADSLRRSKRNKFHLDVASMHLANPERRKVQTAGMTPSPDMSTCRTSSLSPAGNCSPVSSEPSEEKSRRVRRTPAKNTNYVFEDSDDEDCRRGLEGTNLCVKCPARFETRPGLANHLKLHSGEKRKFACELCDFSATTPKSLRLHQRVHDRFGVGPATLSDQNESESHIDDLHCEMPNELTLGSNSSPPQLSPPIAYSACLSRSNTEPSYLSSMVTNSEPSLQSRRAALASPMTPPPNLIRVNTELNSNQECQEKNRKCPDCPYLAKTASGLRIHSAGHKKQSGFQCPFCTFKCGVIEHLKRHVELHGCCSFTWPPDYVGGFPHKWKADSIRTRSRSVMNLLFLRCASQHAPIGSPMRWPCPIVGCQFSAAVVSQHVVHHMQSHLPVKHRTLLRHTCLKCGVCLGTAGGLRLHRILRHTRRHHPRTILYFIRERLGYKYVRNFVKANFEIFDDAVTKTESYFDDDQKVSKRNVKSEAVVDAATNAASVYVKSDGRLQKNEFNCSSCPYSTSTLSNLQRHEIKHQVKEIYQCAHCSFSGRTLECIEKHSRVHQSSSTKTSLSSNSSSSQLQLPPVVLVPMSTVPSIIPLSNSASVITVSLTTVPGEQIAVPANTALPITFATILGSTIVPSTSIDSFTQNVQQETKCPPRRSVTEPSLRFIGSDGVKRRRCLLCPYMSKFSCDMRSHMEMHTMNARFKCSQCSYSTKRAVSLRSHIALHTDDNAIRAKNSKALNIVVQKVLIGVKRGQGFTGFYTCAHCPFVTKICADLWKHARRHMGASKRFNCSLCSFSSISLDVMEQHQLLHPEGVAFIRQHPTDDEDSSSTPVPSCVELKCDVCPFKTTIYQRMWNHKQKHKKTSKFVCSKCTFSTGSEMCLEDHMSVHSEACSIVDTGSAPSHSPSVDHVSKCGSEKSISPDFQKAIIQCERSSREVSNPPAEVSTSRVDAKNPITIKAEYEQAFRPTKEVLAVLKPDPQNQDKRQCPDCPFMDSDDTIFELHREMHGGRTRTFACNLCNYSCFAPETLHWHLSLHLPTLIPANATSQRKRGMGRRGFQTSDPIPFGAKHFACTQCSFRTVNETTFLQHRQQHAQHIQQRLVTQVKRAASQQEEDSKRCSKVKRVAKKSDKHHACMQCTFRCDTSVAFSRHLEMHTQNAIFKCRICDYSANTKNIVDFHEQNHHLGQSLTDLRKTAILAPDVVQLDVTFSSDERARLGGQDLRCRRCHFSTLDLSAYTKHWEQTHKETPEDREVAGELRMKLVPPNSILTTA